MRTLIPWTNLNLPVCSKSQWNKKRVIATRKTPTGNTSQNRLNDSSVTALVIGAGPVRAILSCRHSQSVSFSGSSGQILLLTLLR